MAASQPLRAPFVVREGTGCAIRTRLKDLNGQDVEVLRLVGGHLGSLASRDLRVYAQAGFERNNRSWAVRKQALTAACSSRWAGAITKSTHDQYALARRAQAAHLHRLETTMKVIRHRLAQPLGAKGSKRAPGGYQSAREWRAKAQRLRVLEARHTQVAADWETGRVRVVRGGKRLATTRHHLEEAGLTEYGWRVRWEAARAFFSADGESGKRFGNETIRVTPDGEVSVKLPRPLEHLANAPHGRYVLTGRVEFRHRGEEWADRVSSNRAVAYEIRHDPVRDRWYLTASWKRPAVQTVPLETARAHGVIGVDMNADHLAAYRLDAHGNPVGEPRRFDYDLTGPASHRDAQLRHALTRLMHWAVRSGVGAVAIEDLHFSDSTTREKHGRRKRFRQTVSGIPTGRLKARIVNMAAEHRLTIVAVDPAYTSQWGAQHWQKPLTTANREMTRHDAAAIAIGRRALGHPVRRRTATPRIHQSDGYGHRAAQATPSARGREETRPSIPGQRTRFVPPDTEAKAGDQRAQHRSGHATEHEPWAQGSLPLSL
ncbi:IS200/IS605 family accessory protein TnpB-related protein [Streptomyces fragilis]|uniref:IS200/IS605 family accessory protein TnpB-related protein n=1 Tax=Streptomyces fragilis TaxID=67301 RepID=A0ABV2YMZ0_9ACTN|nr:transposase [Streptomyces fragilis]